ncbi:MAG: TetR/AcrR family transcriptional regulator [Actinomycetales bacterium]
MAQHKRRLERKADLVEAAWRAMLEHGATSVRLNQVAEQAGLTSGAIIYHYPDLQELLLDAHRAGMERFYEQRQRALEGIDSPARKLVVTIASGLPTDCDDADVRRLCELGGAAARNSVYALLLTSLFDRQVSLYQVILESGAAQGLFTLQGDSLAIARNLVALEDAYGYRIMARHGSLDREAAIGLILDYARIATGHRLPLLD